jgi:hypothetical protein
MSQVRTVRPIIWAMEAGYYRVAIRRDLGIEIRKEAEQIDTAIFFFEPGWIIEDVGHYAGETAMLPRDEMYPRNAPPWISSGDLSFVLPFNLAPPTNA